MHILFLFLDGVGLGPDHAQTNPFAATPMPALQSLLMGKKLLADSAPLETERATLVALDASLGVPGMPQSASGQATLLTGWNIPGLLGEHYGPKPNPAIINLLQQGNLFRILSEQGKKTALLNAFPPGYFAGIDGGKRLPGAIAMSARQAGIRLLDKDDLYAGQGFSADFTGEGWRSVLGFKDAPLMKPEEAGQRVIEVSRQYNFSIFEYWLSDMIGHRQDMESARELLKVFDRVLAGMFSTWDDQEGLILITSDHGNLEALDSRRHTQNPVPGLLVGSREHRKEFITNLSDLTGITPAICRLLGAAWDGKLAGKP